MTTLDGEWWGCKCLCLQIDVSFYFPKMPSPRIALIFFQKRPYVSRNCLFVFYKCPFVFQKCLCVSQKMFYSFPESLFSIPEKRSLYLLWVSFSKSGFFQLIVPFLLRAAQIDDICFAVVLFPLGTLCWPTYDAFLTTLTPLHGVWFFVYFI